MTASDFNIHSIQTQLRDGKPEGVLLCLDEIEQLLKEWIAVAHPAITERVEEVGLAVGGAIGACAKERIGLLLVCVQWFLKEGDWSKSINLADRAVLLARTVRAPAILRRSLNVLGVCHSQARNLPDAIVCFGEAIEIAEQIGDALGKCATIANLAEAQFNAGLLEESIALNRYVIANSADEPHMAPVKFGAFHNMAIAFLALGDSASAHVEIRNAEEFATGYKHQFWELQRVIFESTYCKILLREGKLEDARARLALVHEYARRSDGRPSRVQALIAQAIFDAATQNTKAALAALESVKEEVRADESLIRDIFEAELACNRYSGSDDFTNFYQDRYLSNLASWQRRSAIEQVANLQKSIRAKGNVQECIESLAIVAELREDVSGKHLYRTGRLAAMVATRVGYDEVQSARFERAVRLHDIGKLAIPDAVLLKPSTLTAAESRIVRKHTIEGALILADLIASAEASQSLVKAEEVETVRLAGEIALYHHEWWDGSGYPRGVAGESIPQSARIASISDVFDEMTHDRPYRSKSTVQEALDEISGLAGQQFEPRIVRIFLEVVEDLRSEFGQNLDAFMGIERTVSPLLQARRTIDRILRDARADGHRKAPRRAVEVPV